MSNKTIIIGVIVALLLTGGIFYWKFTNSPQYSLLQVARAIENHDYISFEKYVDNEAILNSSIDQVFEIIIASVDPKNEWGTLGQYFGSGMLNMIKPQLTLLYKKQIQEWIQTGKFENDSTSKELTTYSLPHLFARQGAVNFTGIEHELRDRESAVIGLGVRLERFDTTLVFSIKMKNKGGYWQVSELMNLVTFQKELDHLEEKRVDQINKPIEQQMLNTLKISNYDKMIAMDQNGKTKKVRFKLTFENTGNRTIAEYGAVINLANANHSVSKEIRIDTKTMNGEPEKFEPGNTEVLTWPRDGTFYADAQLYTIAVNELSLNLTVDFIQFGDGSSLRLEQKWGPLSKN